MLHIGILKKDSPGLSALIDGLFSQEEQHYIHKAYSLAFRYGALNEGEVKRIEGASYNPRPARIAQILLTEGSIKECDVLITSILNCAEPIIFKEEPNDTHIYYSNDTTIRSILSGIPYKNIASPLIAIVFSHILDKLRHLHMCNFDPIEYKKRLKQIDNIYYSIKESEKDLIIHSRLMQLIEAAITRASHRLLKDE